MIARSEREGEGLLRLVPSCLSMKGRAGDLHGGFKAFFNQIGYEAQMLWQTDCGNAACLLFSNN